MKRKSCEECTAHTCSVHTGSIQIGSVHTGSVHTSSVHTGILYTQVCRILSDNAAIGYPATALQYLLPSLSAILYLG